MINHDACAGSNGFGAIALLSAARTCETPATVRSHHSIVSDAIDGEIDVAHWGITSPVSVSYSRA